MDLNVVVLSGRLAAPPELRVFESGLRLVRYLITVRADEPRRRVDVLPVTKWEPSDEDLAPAAQVGQRIWAAGSVQRRFWSHPDGRRSLMEIVADQVQLRSQDVVAIEP